MITERTIRYTSDFGDVAWRRRLSACQSVADLRALLSDWPSLTDAAAVVEAMTDADWKSWRLFHKRSQPDSKVPPPMSGWKRGYGALVIPQRFLDAITVADHYRAPFGCAWIRLKEMGLPQEQGREAQR